MAVSLEARAPLLDHKLIDFVTGVPASLKLAGFETKHLLKEAVKDLIPAEILHRPKQGFGVPIQEWINQQLRSRIRDTLRDAALVSEVISTRITWMSYWMNMNVVVEITQWVSGLF
jgi:Asparagine synthase (glutamine-hydrolyzing)